MGKGKRKAAKRKMLRRREDGLNDLAAVITSIYGDRCDRREPVCICCHAWMVFDYMEKLCDSSMIEDG